MNDFTRLLDAAAQGDRQAAAHLLPLVYDELRHLAAVRMAQERPGHTLDATALVHEAYLRLVASGEATAPGEPHWNSRGHFFGAAAEAMRRILIDNARRKASDKRGGGHCRVPLDAIEVGRPPQEDDLLALDEALAKLAEEDPPAARLIELRYFGGLAVEDAAEMLGIARSTAYAHWSYARVRLRCLLLGE